MRVVHFRVAYAVWVVHFVFLVLTVSDDFNRIMLVVALPVLSYVLLLRLHPCARRPLKR